MHQNSSILEKVYFNKKIGILVKLYENGETPFSDLKGVVSNPNYLKKIVDALEDRNAIFVKKIGNQKFLSPNVADNIDLYAMIELIRKARFMEMNRNTVAPYINELVKNTLNSAFILVYGSYATGTSTPHSDIDICITAAIKAPEIKKRVSEIFSSSRIRVQLLLETVEEFQNASDNLHKSIIVPKNHIVLSGMHNFLSAVYRGQV